MKVLWLGDAVAPTGFSKCTHGVCDYLHAQGHDVTVLGINYFGSGYEYPYRILPCYDPSDGSPDYWGVNRLPRVILRERPDIVIILQDPWNIKGYFDKMDEYFSLVPIPDDFQMPIMIGWIAVDAHNQAAARELQALDHVITWTHFGAEELSACGYEGGLSIIPLGVDTSIFKPVDKLEARSRVFASVPDVKPTDFIVGYVGRNQHRKRIDLLIKYFAEWLGKYRDTDYSIDDTWLYLHVAPTGDKAGCDIRSLCRYYRLKNRIILARPQIGSGNSDSEMADIYSAMDVFLTTSQAEGWCLPAIEAMACGVPVIYPDAAGMDWAKGAGIGIKCSTTALCAPMDQSPYTIGSIPDQEPVTKALDQIYESIRNPEAKIFDGVPRGQFKLAGDLVQLCRANGLELASRLSWQNAGAAFETLLRKLVEKREREMPYSNGASVTLEYTEEVQETK